ncbi:ABC transporter permease [Longispora fulva]|uniref:ABC-2 type transport system permease protein n=1 Tax=Longispora fulva TaxID=619741 RepID=A0A8J7GNC0_9ACTN|nr:ABC transporter permease [Longispora fulva]MBG6141611.1 ABC-2 type transport system permease protein [Longispora fulva]GIG59236.1 ABC transporter permease [Longispora fulva]
MIDALASEWLKIRTIRSMFWALLAAAALTVGIGMLASSGTEPGSEIASSVSDNLAGVIMGQLAICVFGALAATSEYATGMIRTSLSVLPVRGRMLTAKALVVTAVGLVAGLVISFLSYAVGQSVTRVPAGLGDPGVLRAVLGGGLYLGVLGLFAFGIGMIVRHSAAAITTAIGAVLILPVASLALGDAGVTFRKWWPSQAGQSIMQVTTSPESLAPWAGFGVFAAGTAAVLTGAWLLFSRRDA